MEPCIHIERIPCHLKSKFLEGVFSSQEWTHLIIDMVAHVSVSDEVDNDVNLDDEMGDEDGGKEEDEEFEIKLTWEEGESATLEANKDWGLMAQAHRAALELLYHAVSKTYAKC
jgi:hypothetical protein